MNVENSKFLKFAIAQIQITKILNVKNSEFSIFETWFQISNNKIRNKFAILKILNF